MFPFMAFVGALVIAYLVICGVLYIIEKTKKENK